MKAQLETKRPYCNLQEVFNGKFASQATEKHKKVMHLL